MKILLLTNSLEVGGIEVNIVRLARAFVKQGHEVLCASRPGPFVSPFEAAGGRHYDIDMTTRSRHTRQQQAEALRQILERERPDVVHIFSASSARLLRRARRRSSHAARQIPRVCSIMGLKTRPDESPIRTFGRAYLTCLGSARIFVISPAISKVVRRLPVRRSRIVMQDVVGIDPAEVQQSAPDHAESPPGFQAQEELVLTVGRLDPSKSHDLFIRAAAHVCQTRPRCVFAIAGGGPLKNELAALAEQTRVGDRIRFLGERNDIPALMRFAKVIVRPGIVEGFVGITVLEAQALSKPVVAFETEDVRLSITDGVSGTLVAPSNVEALVSAVSEILDNPQEAHRLGQGGYAAVARFSMDTIARSLAVRYVHEITTGGHGKEPSPDDAGVTR